MCKSNKKELYVSFKCRSEGLFECKVKQGGSVSNMGLREASGVQRVRRPWVSTMSRRHLSHGRSNVSPCESVAVTLLVCGEKGREIITCFVIPLKRI